MGALASQVAGALRVALPGVIVYDFAVPSGALPASYILVRAGVIDEYATRLCSATDKARDLVRVLAVASAAQPKVAASQAEALRSSFVPVLRDWRPPGSQRALRWDVGGEAFRDASLPAVTYTAPVQYRLIRHV